LASTEDDTRLQLSREREARASLEEKLRQAKLKMDREANNAAVEKESRLTAEREIQRKELEVRELKDRARRAGSPDRRVFSSNTFEEAKEINKIQENKIRLLCSSRNLDRELVTFL
jgi:hypothetical protein